MNSKALIIILTLVVIGLAGYGFLTMPDQRTTGQKIGDAVDALPNGLDKAAEQLESRTPGEKLGDAVKDAGSEIKDATNKD